MTVDQWLQVGLNLISLLGLVMVLVELRESNRQKKLDSQIQLNQINRELISLGFAKPELFEILNNSRKADPIVKRRYLQLWLNQLSLVYAFKTSGAFHADYEECCERDLRDMMKMPSMRHHWSEFKQYYPASFQKWVDSIPNEAG